MYNNKLFLSVESLDSNDRLFEELESRIREEGKVSVDEQGQVKFSVWVSFAEIYNEQIYDLLELVPQKKKNYRRPCLKLSEDKNGSPYIKGKIFFKKMQWTIYVLNDV